ncbi:hypothetical protein Ancab_001621 [Ancistrocladus abbreviatus]
MVDPRKEDDQPKLQTEMAGLVARKVPKSQTLEKEPTSAGEKDLLHVPRCTGCYSFFVDLDAVQSIFNGDSPSPTGIQPEMGLSTSLEQEMLDPQYEANVNEDVEAFKKSKRGSKKLNKTDEKVLRFDEEDEDGVRLGESVSDSQFVNKNRVICAGNGQSNQSRPNLYPEQIWNFLSQIGINSHNNDAEMIHQVTEMERRDALMFVEIEQ